MPTESLGPFSVNHQDVTTHDISQPDGEININSAQIRWRGVSTSETSTEYESNNNVIAQDQTIASGSEYQFSGEFPDYTKGSFRNHRFDIYVNSIEKSDEEFATMDFQTRVYNNNTGEWVYDSGIFTETIDININILNTINTNYTDNKYSGVIDMTNKENYNIDVDVQLTTTSEYEETTTYYTEDPNVTRDVDGSYTGTLLDGEWSTWEPLNNLTPNGNEEFYHNISGSQKADFEFEYTWEYTYPDAVGGYWNIYDADQNAIHRVALADPTDSLLDYNHHRFALGGTTYALDVVDPTDGDAIEWRRWYHPTHGIYCPRATQTITL